MKNFKLWIDSFILASAFIWLVISYFISFAGEPDLWFARSGAILVLAAVIVEFRLGGMIMNEISAANAVAGLGIPSGVSISKENVIVARLAHTSAIFGTVVWAYGDLLY